MAHVRQSERRLWRLYVSQSVYGANKTVKARHGPWLSGENPSDRSHMGPGMYEDMGPEIYLDMGPEMYADMGPGMYADMGPEMYADMGPEMYASGGKPRRWPTLMRGTACEAHSQVMNLENGKVRSDF